MVIWQQYFTGLMNQIIYFLLISVFSCALMAAQIQDCVFSDHSIDGVEEIRIGDRRIYTLFTPHMGNLDKEPIFSIIRTSLSEIERNTLLREHILKILTLIRSEQADVSKMTSLARMEQIDWLGIERSPRDVEGVGATANLIQGYRTTRELFLRVFYLSPSPSIELSAPNVLSIIYDPYIIFLANTPEHNIQVVPLEDDILRSEGANILNNFGYWIDIIAKNPDLTDEDFSAFTSFMDDYEKLYASQFTFFDLPYLEEFLDRLGVEEHIRPAMRMLFMVTNEMWQSVTKRDELVVQSILNQTGNGLILFGTGHSKGIQQGLITACQANHSISQ